MFERIMIGEDGVSYPYDWLVEILATNYAVTANEIGALGLLRRHGQQGFNMLKMLVDFATYEQRIQKKSEIEITTDTNAGDAA